MERHGWSGYEDRVRYLSLESLSSMSGNKQQGHGNPKPNRACRVTPGRRASVHEFRLGRVQTAKAPKKKGHTPHKKKQIGKRKRDRKRGREERIFGGAGKQKEIRTWRRSEKKGKRTLLTQGLQLSRGGKNTGQKQNRGDIEK